MDAEQRREDAGGDPQQGADEPAVRAHESRPGRVVFTEAGNTDGWIATDLAVDPRR